MWGVFSRMWQMAKGIAIRTGTGTNTLDTRVLFTGFEQAGSSSHGGSI